MGETFIALAIRPIFFRSKNSMRGVPPYPKGPPKGPRLVEDVVENGGDERRVVARHGLAAPLADGPALGARGRGHQAAVLRETRGGKGEKREGGARGG